MRNSARRYWDCAKTKGEGIGRMFFLFGILGLLTFLGLVPAEIQIWLLGASLGLLSVGLGFMGIGLAAKTDGWVKGRLAYLQGTVREGQQAELDLFRSAQSRGDYTLACAGEEEVVYESSKDSKRRHPFYFGTAWVRLDSMNHEDVVRIRLYIREDGKWSQVSRDEDNTYSGMQDTMKAVGGGFYNQEGVRITAERTVAGSSPLTIGCYAYAAMRGG